MTLAQEMTLLGQKAKEAARLLAKASPVFDIRAVTTCAGNQTIEKTTYNARRICALLGIDAPVAMGRPAPLLADPVSTIKAPKLKPVLGRLTALKPNRIEAELLSGVTIQTDADAARAAEKLLETGLRQVYISLGSDGLYAADREGHTARIACPKIQVANATGGGDAAAAALAACIAHGKPLAETARLAIGAGALACTASETIHPGMSWENIRYILDKEEL